VRATWVTPMSSVISCHELPMPTFHLPHIGLISSHGNVCSTHLH
jgi:hypothetical protein